MAVAVKSEPDKAPRVLVITLYSGEHEFEQCQAALRSQDYRNWEHHIISHKPNWEAHCELYNRIMDTREHYDLYIKLDADMVLNSEHALSDIVGVFARAANLDHAVFAVRDWYSGRDIMGVHVFSSRVSWPGLEDRLFVDPSPQIEGERRFIWAEPSPVADHSPDPSDTEAFLFGAHRALKVVQHGKRRKNIFQARFQLQLLYDVWRMFLRSGDPRRGWVLCGAEQVFAGRLRELSDKGRQASANEILSRLGCEDGQALQHRLSRVWGNRLVRHWRLWRYVYLEAIRSRLSTGVNP